MSSSASTSPCRRIAAWLPLIAVFAATSALHAQEKHVFNPNQLPMKLPFSQGIQVGDMLWVAGTEGDVKLDIEGQTRTALEGIKKVLDAAGYQPSEVVQVTVYLKDVSEFPRMNAVYTQFFPDPKPTRATVQVAGLVNDAHVEIAAVAVHNRPGNTRPALGSPSAGSRQGEAGQ